MDEDQTSTAPAVQDAETQSILHAASEYRLHPDPPAGVGVMVEQHLGTITADAPEAPATQE